MIRRLLANTLALLLITGCADARRPSVRGVAREPDSQAAHSMPSTDSFHSPHGGHVPREALGPEVQLGSMSLTAPEGWVRKAPQSSFVLAEFMLPRAQGDPVDARLTVTAVGGSIEENVARWRSQFGGETDQEKQEDIEVQGIRATLIDFSGTYRDQHMGLAPAQERSNYRMLAAIFSVGDQQYVIKCYGARDTMAEHADEFAAFVRSLKPVQTRAAAGDVANPGAVGSQLLSSPAGEAGSAEAGPVQKGLDTLESSEAEAAESEVPEPEETRAESTEPM